MEIACSRVSCLPARVFGGDFPVTEVDIRCRRAPAFRAARAHQRILQIIKSSTANTIKVMRKSLGPTHPWIKTNMAPLRGWGTRGERLITHVPHGHWQTMTFIGALRHDRIEAPWVLDGPINAEAFKTYVRAELLKTLKPDDIVVLDNLNSHKGKAVRAMVKAIGARLFFLQSYSPDLNPIEQAFAKIKHAMRKAMGRSVEAVCNFRLALA
jgi:transposase